MGKEGVQGGIIYDLKFSYHEGSFAPKFPSPSHKKKDIKKTYILRKLENLIVDDGNCSRALVHPILALEHSSLCQT